MTYIVCSPHSAQVIVLKVEATRITNCFLISSVAVLPIVVINSIELTPRSVVMASSVSDLLRLNRQSTALI